MAFAVSIARFLHQLEALHDSEAVLFIHNHQAQFGEFYFLLDQGMGSDHQLGIALGDVAANLALAVFFQGAGQQHDAVSGIFQNPARGKIVLLRQNFSRRHERNLIPVFHGDDCSLKSHDRFARSHVSLQQPPHGKRLLHVGGDFLQHPLLRRRGMERKDLLDGFAHAVVQAERDSGLGFLLAAFELESQLQKEKFFKDQPHVRWGSRGLQILKALAGIGPVTCHSASRGAIRLRWRRTAAGTGSGSSGGRFSKAL